MKSSVLSLVLVAGLAAAQSKLPTCASKCMTEYTTGGKIAGCGSLDVACICKNQDFLSGISCCLQDACDTAGQEEAIKYAGQICSTAGVTVPSKLTCSSSSSASKSGSSSGSATKSASGSTGTPGSSATATGDSASGTSTGTATGSSSSSTSSGSAAAGTYSAGGLLGAIAAVLFAL